MFGSLIMKESKFQIINQRLTKITYSINENYLRNEIELKFESNVQVKRDDSQSVARVTLNLFLFRDEEIETVPFKIELENVGYFKWDKSLQEQSIEKMLKFNAPALLLSNIRSIVSQITAFSGYPPLVLPLFDFTQ